jgi:hypothetical protein
MGWCGGGLLLVPQQAGEADAGAVHLHLLLHHALSLTNSQANYMLYTQLSTVYTLYSLVMYTLVQAL